MSRYDPLNSTFDVNDKLQKQRKTTLSIGVLLAIALAVVVLLGVLYASERSSSSQTQSDNSFNPAQEVQQNISAFILSQLDTSTNPCDDFYQFSCGGWLKSTPLPADKALSYLVIDPIEDANLQILQRVLESDLQWPMISNLYAECSSNTTDVPLGAVTSFVNTAKIIDSLPSPISPQQAATILSRLHLGGAAAFFTFSVGADLLNSALNTGQLYQGGIALSDPSYYLNDTKYLPDYATHIANMFKFLNDAKISSSPINPVTAAQNVIALETQLVSASWTAEQLRDLNATYNKKSPNDLTALVPNIDWTTYLTAMGLIQSQNVWVNVQVLQFAAAVNTVLSTATSDQLQHYLFWNLLHAAAPYLNSTIQQENFNFFEATLNGIEQPEPKWKQCVEVVDDLLGQLSGRFYVEAAFNQASKQLATDMMHTVIQAMYRKIASVDWMDAVTKANATKKLDQFTGSIGYPDHWETYSGLALQYTSYYDDVIAIEQWQTKSQVSQIGLPVDRTIWSMTTPTVNAYYDPSTNHIVIPAGILQGYYFNLLFHPAINYGGTGGTLGHELTHAFDDQGSQYDGQGNYVNWWSPETLTNWNNRTGCLADYYSEFTVNGTHLNGRLTLGENTADCGGIKQAFTAYHDFIQTYPSSVPGIDVNEPYLSGYTNDQLFFIAYAQGWCAEYSPEYEESMLKTNPHSPSEFRVNGPLAQFDQFSQVFNCPANSKMNLQNRCDVW